MKFLAHVVKSNGLLITFPIMWLVIAFRDVTKGQFADAALEVGLALVMLAIPLIADRFRQKSDNEIVEFGLAVDKIWQVIWDALPKWVQRLLE